MPLLFRDIPPKRRHTTIRTQILCTPPARQHQQLVYRTWPIPGTRPVRYNHESSTTYILPQETELLF